MLVRLQRLRRERKSSKERYTECRKYGLRNKEYTWEGNEKAGCGDHVSQQERYILERNKKWEYIVTKPKDAGSRDI